MKNSTYMRVGCVHSQGDGCSRFRVSKDGNRGKEDLGAVEGGVEDRGPLKRFTQTLEGVCERNRVNKYRGVQVDFDLEKFSS